MSVRRLAGLLLAWLIVPALAHADSHIADSYSGGSGGGGGSTLYGVHQSFTAASRERFMGCFWGGTADVTFHFGADAAQNDETQVAYMFGPRCTFARPHKGNVLHAQLLLGWVYTNAGVNDGKDKAVGYSILYDRTLKSCDAPCEGMAARVQYDYINRAEDHGRENFSRLSAGVVYRFAKH